MGLLEIPWFFLTLTIGVILLGDIIELLKIFVGPLAYIFWIIAAPILAPAGFFLPWFDAWVSGVGVNPVVFWLWVVWLTPLAIITVIMALSDLIRRFKN